VLLTLGLGFVATASLGCDGSDDRNSPNLNLGSGASSGTGASGTGGGSGGTGTGANGGSGNDGGTGNSGTGGAASGETCQQTCSAVTDCFDEDEGDPDPFNSDNWSCDTVCVYEGCNSDAECGLFGQVCRGQGGIDVCVDPCATADDCASVGSTVDADNWECQGGGCLYLGCSSDAECFDDTADPNSTCRDTGGTPFCDFPCASVADCATANSPAFDEDNWSCNGFCEYTGCNDNTECASLGAGFQCL